jgi:predicted metal-dependent hydrolase
MNLTVRRLQIDLGQGFSRHWHGGDAFRTAYYNALSMSFPVGEQYFIDSVRAGLALLPDTPEHAAMRSTVQAFIGQEATHRHLHGLYNAHLEKQGLTNQWQHWAGWRIRHSRRMHPLNHLAITCAYEHCTAVFAEGTLRHPEWFEPAEPQMRLLWRWHASEEAEHRGVAFDLYRALGGGWWRRSAWHLWILTTFAIESSLQTAINLWRDKTFFKPSTWLSALSFAFGRDRVVWRATLPLLGYLRPGFHPVRSAPAGDELAAAWLRENEAHWRAVR